MIKKVIKIKIHVTNKKWVDQAVICWWVNLCVCNVKKHLRE